MEKPTRDWARTGHQRTRYPGTLVPQFTCAVRFKRRLGGLVTVPELHNRSRHDENAGERAQWQGKEKPLVAPITFTLCELAVQYGEPGPKSAGGDLNNHG